MDLILIQIQALQNLKIPNSTFRKLNQQDSSSDSEEPLTANESEYEFYLRTKGIDWMRSIYRPSEEAIRIRDEMERTQTDFQAEDSPLPDEYPFQNFNYGP